MIKEVNGLTVEWDTNKHERDRGKLKRLSHDFISVSRKYWLIKNTLFIIMKL